VHRDRDFNRVEARVTFVAKIMRGQPPRRISIYTSQPPQGDAPLRERLVADAARLVRARLPVAPTATAA
jgi:hypothetical protein